MTRHREVYARGEYVTGKYLHVYVQIRHVSTEDGTEWALPLGSAGHYVRCDRPWAGWRLAWCRRSIDRKVARLQRAHDAARVLA